MEEPIFTSLGMFILDDNEYPKSWNRAPEYNIIGGGGSYSIVGARMIAGSQHAKAISGFIDKERDFPNDVLEYLKDWGTGTIFRYDDSRLTTRGKNVYDENDIRHFYYLTDKKRIEMQDLVEHPLILQSRCFHIICSVERCKQLINDIRLFNPTAKFIYEPLPSDCVAANLESLCQLLPSVDIFTPNLNEGCDLLGQLVPVEIEAIANIAQQYLTLGAKNCILRCGPLGCYVANKQAQKHLPAYHQIQTNVVDVTGGGNSFCGGCMVGYYLSGDIEVAGVCGNLVSGCIIERLGMPTRDGIEWNGKSMKERLKIYGPEKYGLANKFDWLS